MRTCLSIMVRDKAGVFIQDSLSLKLAVSHSTPSPLVGVCVSLTTQAGRRISVLCFENQRKEPLGEILLPVSHLVSLSQDWAGGSDRNLTVHVQIFCCSTYENMWPRGCWSWSTWGCEQKYSLVIWPSSPAKTLGPPCVEHPGQSWNQRKLPVTSQQIWQLGRKAVSLFCVKKKVFALGMEQETKIYWVPNTC